MGVAFRSGWPQSNQRGIETPLPTVSGVGRPRPQSNQRGIETGQEGDAQGVLRGPQSNQRGIETVRDGGEQKDQQRSLNRTSVGLKLPDHDNPVIGVGVASIEPAWD